ncbi:Cyclophilin-type peptidyl-prolyl cis-trans isomerase domain [Trypanosoma melophagium]|uniref:Cyclophilin-type peptidyl-prolyl cis-trans isomerase domain n=1 Tax=Trypanosoma melophagium TaxID=715481 RepID=UPI00351A6463|nr:Cyclophilin-type peptidyl-prolyl cis-trans isomerase domain [Trypanosoma melophagium]
MSSTRSEFTVCGLVNHPVFQQCTEAAAYLQKEYSDLYYVDIFYEVPRDFYSRRQKLLDAKKIDDEKMDVIVIQTGVEQAMSGEAFLQRVQQETKFRVLNIPHEHPDSYVHMALASWKKFLRGRGNSYSWMLVAINGVVRGRITFELYAQLLPRTCNNFWHLCCGDLGTIVRPREQGQQQVPVPHKKHTDKPQEKKKKENHHHGNGNVMEGGEEPQQGETTGCKQEQNNGKTKEENEKEEKKEKEEVRLSYKGTTFFRTLHGAWVMGGDITGDHGGNGGHSCYGRYFPDESYAVPHDSSGVLGMCNDGGGNTNASAFYITMKPMTWMNGRYVAFGRVMDGMDVVEAIHNVDVRHNQSPREVITIFDCGVIDLTE